MKINILGAACLSLVLISVAAAQDLITTVPEDSAVSSSSVDSSTSSESPTTSPDGASSSDTAITDTVTSTPVGSSTTKPTVKPDLPKEEVLRQTNITLNNITRSINVFLAALEAITTEAPTTETTTDATTTAEAPPAVFLEKEQNKVREVPAPRAALSDICDESDPECAEFLLPLEGIQVKVTKLRQETDSWVESDLNELNALNDDLAFQVANKSADTDFMTNVIDKTAAQTALGQMITEIDEASNAVNAAIDDLNNNNKNGVIFVAVFCSVGGLIVLALFIGLTVTCVKSKKAKKAGRSKKYKKVPEERVPVEGFLKGHDNESFYEEERGRPKNDSYAMRNVAAKGSAPYTPANDPYTRSPGGRYDDPYSRTSKPQNIADYYSKPDDYYTRPGTSKADDYYSRGQGSTKPEDLYTRPAKGPNQGGLKRYY